MIKYELTILGNPDYSKEELEERIRETLKEKNIKLEYNGLKTLSYPVNGYEKARYFYLEVYLNAMEANLLGNYLYSADTPWCLRYLLVKKSRQFSK